MNLVFFLRFSRGKRPTTRAAMMSNLEEQMIDVTIEALTGAVYDLCVSPFETILGIKMKIQRLEGRSISRRPFAPMSLCVNITKLPLVAIASQTRDPRF